MTTDEIKAFCAAIAASSNGTLPFSKVEGLGAEIVSIKCNEDYNLVCTFTDGTQVIITGVNTDEDGKIKTIYLKYDDEEGYVDCEYNGDKLTAVGRVIISDIENLGIETTFNAQDKEIRPTTETQEIVADDEYDGLGKVTVLPPLLQAKYVVPTQEGSTLMPDDGFAGLSKVTVEGDENLTSENIVSGKTIFGITGTAEGGTGGNGTADEVTKLNFQNENYLAQASYKSGGQKKIIPTFNSDGTIKNVQIGLSTASVSYNEDGTLKKVGNTEIDNICLLELKKLADENDNHVSHLKFSADMSANVSMDDGTTTNLSVEQDADTGKITSITIDSKNVEVQYDHNDILTKVGDVDISGVDLLSMFIQGGIGGGGEMMTQTVLWENDTAVNTGTFDLTDSIYNYDMFYVEGGSSTTSSPDVTTPDSELFAVRPEINGYQWYSYSTQWLAIRFIEGTQVQFPTGSSLYCFRIIGIKFTGTKAVEYSTEEQVVGTWIDGKTLYQKTYVLPISFNSSSSSTYNFKFETDIGDIDAFVHEAIAYFSDGDHIQVPCAHPEVSSVNSNIYINKNNNIEINLGAYYKSASVEKIIATIRYTK